MRTEGLIAVFYRFCEWIMKFFASNALWLIFNLPVVFFVFNLFLAKSADSLLANGLVIALLAPFLFFPSTSALFGVVRKWAIGESDAPIFRTFLNTYKENYKRSMAGGVLFTLLWSILIIDYFYFLKLNSPLIYLFIAIGAYIFVFTLHFVSNTVHVHLPFFPLLKNSMLLAIGRPIHTIGIAAFNVLILYISFNVFTFLIVLGIGSLIAFVSFFLYYKAIPKYEKAGSAI